MRVPSPAEKVACGVSTPNPERRHVPEGHIFSWFSVRHFCGFGVFRSTKDPPAQDVRSGLFCSRVRMMCLNTLKRSTVVAADCLPQCRQRNVGLPERPAGAIDERHLAPGHASMGRANHSAVRFLAQSYPQLNEALSLPRALCANTKATYANGADRWRCIAIPHHPRTREGEHQGRSTS